MRQFFIGLCGVILLAWSAIAAPNFPALTGRVVDDAHILSARTHQQLEQSLADYEAGTSNQVVVATLSSLGGLAIEEYGVQLGRQWQIGQKGKDNGVLLIVAPNEHEVRIEVGYGLEGTLTDAASSQIINQIILPDFRAKNMEKGVVDGTQAVLSVLGGKGIPAHAATPPLTKWQLLLILFCVIGFIWLCIRHPIIAWWIFDSAIRFGGSSGRGGGGFSGGGGSFGGGGASGRW